MLGRKVGWSPYLILPVLVLAMTLLIVGNARAGDPSLQFEIDGNWPVDGDAPTDWANAGGASFSDASGQKETIIEPGTALFGAYPYPTRDNQNSPGKADLTAAWITSVVDGDSLYLYAAAQRAPSNQGGDPGGNTSAIFALHRDAGALNNGDLMIVMDFVNGGTVFVPTVYQYDSGVWTDLGLDSSVASAISNPEGAEGEGGQILPANVFVEAGIHLTDTEILEAGSCLNATQLWIMTSSSQSNSASLQDVLNGGNIDLNNAGVPVTNCGDVTVTKEVDGYDPDSTWEITIDPNVDNFTSDILADGESTDAIQVNPGVPVTITETSVQGLDFTATWECSDGTDGAGSSFEVTASAFEHIECTITNVIAVEPSISVTKTADSATVPQTGDDVTYTFEVENDGDVPVIITELVDDQFGELDGDADCKVDTELAPGESCDFEATFSLPAAAPNSEHTNVFTATVEDEQENEASDDDSETVTYTDVAPEVTVNKVADPDEVLETGGTVTFTFTVTNSGTVPVTITELEDDILGPLAGDTDCQVGTDLAPGESCDFTVDDDLPAGNVGDSHVNTFTATVEDEDGTEDEDSVEEEVTYTDVPPMVNVIKTANPTSVPQSGGDVTFTYVVENDGTVAATITVLDDDQFTLTGDGDCQVGTVLAAGASCEFSHVFEVPAGNVGDEHENWFTATLVDTNQTPDSDTDNSIVTYSDVLPAISMTKTPSPSSVTAPGANVTFTVEITNDSGTDTVIINSLVDDQFGDLDGQGTCVLTQELAPGESYECAFTGEVTGSGGTTHENTVEAEGFSTDNEEQVSAEASATVTITSGSTPRQPREPEDDPDPTPTPTPTPEPTPQILGSTAQIDKVLTSADPAVVGEEVTFDVELTIAGDTDVTEVLLIDTFEHDYLKFVSASTICSVVPNFPDDDHSSIGCEIGTITPGSEGEPGSVTLEYTLVFEAVKSTLPDRTINQVVARMDLDGDGPGGPAEIGPATADVEIIEVLGIQLPPTGDGSMEAGNSPAGLVLVALLASVSLGGVVAVQRRRHIGR